VITPTTPTMMTTAGQGDDPWTGHGINPSVAKAVSTVRYDPTGTPHRVGKAFTGTIDGVQKAMLAVVASATHLRIRMFVLDEFRDGAADSRR